MKTHLLLLMVFSILLLLSNNVFANSGSSGSDGSSGSEESESLSSSESLSPSKSSSASEAQTNQPIIILIKEQTHSHLFLLIVGPILGCLVFVGLANICFTIKNGVAKKNPRDQLLL